MSPTHHGAQRLFNVGPGRPLDLLGEVELEIGEDAPMSMAAHKTIVIVTTQDFRVYSLPSSLEVPQMPSPKKSKGKGRKSSKPTNHALFPKLDLLHTVDVPTITGVIPTFRSARQVILAPILRKSSDDTSRYHPIDSALYVTVNTTSPRTKKTKTPQRQSFVYKWNTKTWTIEKSRKPLVTILKAHDFPPTTIAFNPTSTLLITGSADASVRVVSVPTTIASGSCTSHLPFYLNIN
ncbi:hypothetical protein C0995_000852 [Termitomyces sp. Mi166|nr:hypothetical protein C0995_000852 [Termitomyces sp. Mi166\